MPFVITQGYQSASEPSGAFLLQGLRSPRLLMSGYRARPGAVLVIQGLLSRLLVAQGY